MTDTPFGTAINDALRAVFPEGITAGWVTCRHRTGTNGEWEDWRVSQVHVRLGLVDRPGTAPKRPKTRKLVPVLLTGSGPREWFTFDLRPHRKEWAGPCLLTGKMQHPTRQIYLQFDPSVPPEWFGENLTPPEM